jgi:hypothetical protein
VEHHFMQFILRTEAMTEADHRLADEQMGRIAQRLWLLGRAIVERWRRLTGPRGRIGGAARPAACVPDVHTSGTRRTAR